VCLCHHVDSHLAQGRAASFLLAKGAAHWKPWRTNREAKTVALGQCRSHSNVGQRRGLLANDKPPRLKKKSGPSSSFPPAEQLFPSSGCFVAFSTRHLRSRRKLPRRLRAPFFRSVPCGQWRQTNVRRLCACADRSLLGRRPFPTRSFQNAYGVDASFRFLRQPRAPAVHETRGSDGW